MKEKLIIGTVGKYSQSVIVFAKKRLNLNIVRLKLTHLRFYRVIPNSTCSKSKLGQHLVFFNHSNIVVTIVENKFKKIIWSFI